MRKDILLPGAALAGGLLGFGLRRWQLASAYLPDTQLFLRRAPATAALLAVLAAVLMLLAVLAARSGSRPADFLPAFRCPSAGFMSLMAGAAFVLLGAGVLVLLHGTELLNLWRNYPDSVTLTLPIVTLICGLLCFPAGLALLLTGRCCYRDRLVSPACVLASAPAAAGVAWVLSIHLEHGVDPVLMRFGFLLAAAFLLTLAHYYAVSFLFARCHPRRLTFCTLSGTVLGLTALADFPPLPHILLILGLSASALALTFVLLRNTGGPAWREPFRAPGSEDGQDAE